MNRYINRILLAVAALFATAGTAKAADALTISGSVTNATVKWYNSTAEPTAAPSGAAATTIAPGEWIILEVTPNTGYWTYDEIITIQGAGGIGGAEARTRSIMMPVHLKALSGNQADGKGYYYLQIPAEWKNADGYTKVIVGGEAIPKIDLSSATIDATGKIVTATTGNWTATITLDEVKWTYDESAHGPAISAFELTNGTKTFSNTAAQVAISGSETNPGSYNATLSAVTSGCFLNSKAVPFSIEAIPVIIGGADDASATAKLVISETEFTYTGLDQKPTVKVVLKSDNSEIASTEYNVSYKKGDDAVTKSVNVGTYTVVVSSKTGGKYTFSGATTASYEIKKTPLTIKANDKSIDYGTEAANDGVTYTGFVNGEDEKTESVFSGSLTYAYNSQADGKGEAYAKGSKKGTYYIIPSGLTSTNYDIKYETGILNVGGKTIVIGGDDDASATAKLVIDPTEFTYDGSDHKPTVQVVMKSDNSEIASTEYDVVYKNSKGETVTETKNADTYTVNISSKAGGNYTFSGNPKAEYKIKKVALTVTANDKAISYGEEGANAGVKYNGFVTGESETTEGVFNGSLTYTYNSQADGKGEDYTTSSTVGTYYIIPDGLTSTNYDITFVAGKLTVSKNAIVIGGDDDATATAKLVLDPTEFTYNGKDQKPTVTVVMKSDNSEIASTEYDVVYKKGDDAVTESVNAGTYTVVISSKASGNYTFSGTMTASYKIKPATLTVTAKDKTISYGEEGANDGVTYAGFVNGESETTEGVFSGSLTYTYNSQADGKGDTYTTSSIVGTYYIIPIGLTSTNYDITFVAGKLKVSDKVIVIGGDDDASATAKLVVDPSEFTYTGKDQKPSVKIVMKSDNSEIASTEYDVVYKKGEDVVTESVNAGTYTVVISNKDGSDYAFSGATTANYKIKSVALTITANDKTVNHGEEGANAGVTYSGFVNGESETTEGVFSGSLTYTYNSKADGKGDTYTTSSSVGTYYIIPSGLTSTNYDITFVAGKLMVSDKVIVIGGDDDASATAKLVVDPSEFTYNGKDQKPTVKVVMKSDNSEIASTEYTVVYKKGSDAVTETKDVGSYTLEITNKEGAVYAFSGSTTASYKINRAALTVTAKDKTISYGEEAANDGVTYSGFVNGESETTEGVFSGSLTYTYNSKADGSGDAYTTSSLVGTYYIIPSGLTSTNYDITFAAGKLTVSKNPIVIGGDDDPTATAKLVVDPTEFTYNGLDQKPTVKVVLKSDNSEITSTEYDVKFRKGENAVTDTKDAGTYTVVISNKEGADYAFSGATTASYQIKSVALTVTANDKTISYGDAAANAGVTFSGFVNNETSAVLGGTLEYAYNSKADGSGTAYTTSSPVGTYYIIPSGLTSTNYDITFAAGKLTVSKNPIVIGGDDDPTATAKLVVDPTEFTYNGEDQKPTVKVVMKSDNSEIASTEYTVIYKKGDDTMSESVNAGTYTVVISNKDGSDYAFSGATTANYVIKPADATLEPPTAKTGLVENGVNQELVDAGSATGGTLEYSLDGTNWSTDIPTGRKADTYTVYYRVIGDQNHNDIDAASLSVTIAEQENPEPVDRKHSGIRVVRNDTQEVIDNDVFLILIGGKLRIEQIDICETNDLEKLKQVGVSIYIPEELTTPSGAKAKTSGMAQDIIVNKNNLPVTDIYMPETEQMLNVGKHAFRLDPTESTTAFIHVPLHLLDNYALTMGLQAEYEAGKVMTTVKPSTVFWTFSSAVDIVMPDGLAANICKSKGDKWVNFEIITTPKVDVDGTQRTLIKANNGILMRCSSLPIGSYELRAWPSDERPSGLSPIPTDNAYSYPGNELVPVIEPTHFEPTQYYILFNNLFSELEPDDKTSVTACKAVLPKSSNLQARTLTLIDGEGTGIEALSLTPSLEEAGSWYDLQGRKLSGKPKTKGVYIHNGKQEIIK